MARGGVTDYKHATHVMFARIGFRALAVLPLMRLNVRHVAITVLVLTVAGPSWAATARSDTPAIKIGLIPERNIFDQVARYEALAEYLSSEVDARFQLTMLSRYGNIVERITSNEVLAAFLGSFTGGLASAQLGMEPIARPVNKDGTSTYFGRIFVRKDSGIKTVADMQGKRLALVERATTAGYMFPRAYMRTYGVEDLWAFFSEVRFWGSHDATVSAVLDGEADVGAAKNTVMDWRMEADPRVEEELRILTVSPRVPSNGLFMSASLDSGLKEQVRDLLLNLHNTVEGKAILQKMGASRFEVTRTADYGPVFDLAAKAGIDIESYRYVNK
jgi:phosphonate transport system substrate-binding protein